MSNPFVVSVAGLLSGREATRRLSAAAPISLQLEQVTVDGDANVEVLLEGIGDRISATGTVDVGVRLTCVRCLTTWNEPLSVPVSAFFASEPHEDEYPVTGGTTIDLTQPVRDEVASSVPLLPLCRADCAGLCPVCGTDLNTFRCAGHEVEDDSPFAVLRPLIPD